MSKSLSAGGVIVNQHGQIAIVSQPNGSWSLPKGRLQDNESIEQATRREITEETGLTDLTFIQSLGTYQRYQLDSNNQEDLTKLKEMHISLFRTNQDKLQPTDPDNTQARWATPDQAVQLLTHPKDKEFIRQLTSLISAISPDST